MTEATERPGGAGGGSATVSTVRVFGALTAFTGIEHGLGEVSQGPVAPPALVFESWPQVPAFDPLDGEPAMSLIPNLLISGLASVLVALVLGVVACYCPRRPRSGRLLLCLSLLLLLVGGGFGPPVLGVLTGLLAIRIDASPAHRPGPVTRLGARLWPWPLLAATGSFLGLVPGTALLYAAGGRDLSTLVAVLTLAAFTTTGLAMWTARARDRISTGGGLARPDMPSGGRRAPGPDTKQQSLHGQRPAPATSRARGPRRAFRLWAALWSIIVSTLFLSVTALTLALWATDPDYAETTPVTDLGFFALGAVIATGFLSQLRADPPVTGVHQAVLATVALAAAGLLGRRVEPLVGALLILVALAILAALHPARRGVLWPPRPPGRPVSVALTTLAVVVAAPAAWQATRLLDVAAAAGPSAASVALRAFTSGPGSP